MISTTDCKDMIRESVETALEMGDKSLIALYQKWGWIELDYDLQEDDEDPLNCCPSYDFSANY